jgi:hypothetical protein
MFFQLTVLTAISQLYWSSSDKLQEVWELWVKLLLTIKWNLSLFNQNMFSQSLWHDWLHIFNALATLQWKAPVPVARSYPELLLLILRLTAIPHHTKQFQFVVIVSTDIGRYGYNAVTGFSLTELLSHCGRPWTCKSKKPVSFPIDNNQFMLEH